MKNAEKILILKGAAGLGNRLSSLTCAINYCLKNNRMLYVDWSDGMMGKKGENVFYKYFDLKEVPFLLEFPNLNAKKVHPHTWVGKEELALWEVYSDLEQVSQLKAFFFKKMYKSHDNIFGVWFPKEAKTSFKKWKSIWQNKWMPLLRFYPKNLTEDVLVGCDYNPKVDKNVFNQHVSFKSEVLKKIEEKIQKIGVHRNFLGIHVRKTDWVWEKKLDMFYEKINLLPKDRNIFLSTDDASVFNKIKELNPNVRYQEKFLPNVEVGGLHHYAYHQSDGVLAEKMFFESLVDMMALSKCEELWCQKGSTFSEFAHLFSKDQKFWDWSQI